jgi:hypothetical protein
VGVNYDDLTIAETADVHDTSRKPATASQILPQS